MIHGTRCTDPRSQLGLCCWAKCRLQPQPSRSLRKFAAQKVRPEPTKGRLNNTTSRNFKSVQFAPSPEVNLIPFPQLVEMAEESVPVGDENRVSGVARKGPAVECDLDQA